ncbi:MAG: helix-turn-helix transcriptional regulator [Acholeplasma sp.]|jgi:putative transcriptional regulator|nr:helix-turn-helix transcriptional regulator [Acholeplasma sp.]
MKNRIAELRKEKKISQTDLADAVFVSRQTITSIEIDKYTASLELAYKIAKYFDLSIEDVFDFSNVEVKKND